MFKKTDKIKENFMSRKYHLVLFWNVLAGISVGVQSLLSYVNVKVNLPLEIIIGIAGVLSGAYMGVNIWEKKINGIQAAKDALVGDSQTENKK